MSLRTQLSDIFHERTNYDFIGPTKRWFAISGLLIAIGLAGLGVHSGELIAAARGGFAECAPASGAPCR